MQGTFTEGSFKAFAFREGHAGKAALFLTIRKFVGDFLCHCATVLTALTESLFLWTGFTVEGVYKRQVACKRLILEDLAYFTRSISSCCVVSVSLIQLPAINFSETELPGNRFAISDKLACFYSPIDSHNENCVINLVFSCCLCARKLRSGNLCFMFSYLLSSLFHDRIFSVLVPLSFEFLFHVIDE